MWTRTGTLCSVQTLPRGGCRWRQWGVCVNECMCACNAPSAAVKRSGWVIPAVRNCCTTAATRGATSDRRGRCRGDPTPVLLLEACILGTEIGREIQQRVTFVTHTRAHTHRGRGTRGSTRARTHTHTEWGYNCYCCCVDGGGSAGAPGWRLSLSLPLLQSQLSLVGADSQIMINKILLFFLVGTATFVSACLCSPHKQHDDCPCRHPLVRGSITLSVPAA